MESRGRESNPHSKAIGLDHLIRSMGIATASVCGKNLSLIPVLYPLSYLGMGAEETIRTSGLRFR